MTTDTYAKGIIEALRYEREEIAARRDRVLAHPDLAERLTQRPVDYTLPGQWNGFVPPESHDGRHNRSPRREALVALVDEARAREAKSA